MANRRQFLNSLGLLVLCAGAIAQPAHKGIAILVGVSKFDHLKITPLEGPPNDVVLMRGALHALGYRDADVTTLVDTQPAELHPTRNNILRVMRAAAAKLHRGDNAIIYFSGHGSQVPQNIALMKQGYVEPDGLDEVFLTRDTRYWNRATRTVEGALLDDHIGEAISAFTRKGVQVWAIFDTCHAGDMARSPSNPEATIWRGVHGTQLAIPDEELLGTPRADFSQAFSRHRGKAPLILFYASKSDESTPEEYFNLPNALLGSTRSNERRRFGVFTWEIANALATTGRTFDELVDVIRSRYDSRPFPTPGFEGPLQTPVPIRNPLGARK